MTQGESIEKLLFRKSEENSSSDSEWLIAVRKDGISARPVMAWELLQMCHTHLYTVSF